MDRQIPFLLMSAVFGSAKPDTAIYYEAVRLLGIDCLKHGNVLFVGDNPSTDIIGAQHAGMMSAWIHMGRTYPGDAPLPDYQIASVIELREILGLSGGERT